MPLSWHAMPVEEVRASLEASREGLSEADAVRRLERYGPNRIAPPRPVSTARILLAQLESVIVYLLIAAIAISLAFGDRVEAAAIAAVLVINTLLGFLTELRARRAMEALLTLDVPRAAVIRDGRLQIIDATGVVPGDVIELEVGRQVPADGRLLAATDLSTDEAALTGESLPVSKSPDVSLPPDTALADRVTMVYKGTTVSAGVGRALVTATGADTEVGRIGVLAGQISFEPTPLERRLDALGRRLVWLTLAVAALVGALGVFHGLEWDVVIETAIALAIAAVPEALPAVATIALAVGVRRMARRHALVRRLPAVEALGSVTVVCTDKTRTLTSGDMAVVRVWADGHDVTLDATAEIPDDARPAAADLLGAAMLASRFQPADASGAVGRGDPVDVAVIAAATGVGIDRARAVRDRPVEGLVPFSSDRKFMAAFYRESGGLSVYAKGAPRAILARCSRVGSRALDDDTRAEMITVNDRFAADGLRVLAVARGKAPAADPAGVADLALLGFLGLADPPAPGVKATIARLKDAGLRTVMLTGDQRLTAEAIGRALGLLDRDARAMDGHELEAVPPDALQASVARQSAFSRISPEHKLMVVRALQAGGEIVAMLGDGVNDAAALKQADVGVAMGVRGTDVAKQSASIVLQDDRFETVAAAVEEGRVIFDNIRKFVFYLFSCNLGEIFVLFGAGVAGLPLPLLPLQLLWLNLVTDTFPALALALEPAEADVMRRPPRRPDEALLSATFVRGIVFYAVLITAATLAAFIWALAVAPDRATTVAFMTLAFAQTAHLGNARSEHAVVHPPRIFANRFAVAAIGLSVALQVAAVSVPPLADLLGVSALTAREWLVSVGFALVPAVTGQLLKLRRKR